MRLLLLMVFLILFVVCQSATASKSGTKWALKTDDTRLTLGIGSNQKLYIEELSNPDAGWNWTKTPSLFPLINRIDFVGKQYTPIWIFKDAIIDNCDGSKVNIRFINKFPALELNAVWQANSGAGPIRITITVKNNSGHTVTIYNQESLDLQIIVPDNKPNVWYFDDGGWASGGYGGKKGEGLFHDKLDRGYSKILHFTDGHDYIPYVVVDANGTNGLYLGWEWSLGRILISGDNKITNQAHLKAGNGDNFKTDLNDGNTFDFPPAFIGAYNGDLDESGNSLRQYLYKYAMPALARSDGYPKVQLNSFNAFADKPKSWNPVQSKFFPTVDIVSNMGFEEFVFDVGWWEGNTQILPFTPKFDPVDWSIGSTTIRNYLSYKKLQWGLYWDRPASMTTNFGISDRIYQIKYMYDNWGLDLWRSDGTAGALIAQGTFGVGTRAYYAEDVSYWQCKGFYEVIDKLYDNIPNFQWENCEGGGQIKDFGTMRRTIKVQIADNYSPLDMQRAFYDNLYIFPPVQLEGMCEGGNGDKKYWFRSTFMGAGTLTGDPNSWSDQDKKDITNAIISYKTKIRPLINSATLNVYHIFPRPDDVVWTGMEYFDSCKQKGVVYIFKPKSVENRQVIKLKGLDAKLSYKLIFEDKTNADTIMTGATLMNDGISVVLNGDYASELMFVEKN